MSTHKIPQTDSIRELAGFWDTLDLTDFEDQLEEVTDTVFEQEAVVKTVCRSRKLEPHSIWPSPRARIPPR